MCFLCRGVKTSQEIAKQETEPVQHKDYSLKAGQKIQINLGVSVIAERLSASQRRSKVRM